MPEDERLDLGLAEVTANTFGEPGQRTFNVTATSERGQAVVWMEKEQLLQLAMALQQLLEQQEAPESPRPYAPEYAHFGEPVSVEFKAGDMRLRYDGGTDAFTVEATDPDSEQEDDDEEDAVALQFTFLRPAARELAEQGMRIVSSGRPECPFCHRPMDPAGHVCPKSNGHQKTELSL